MIKAWVIGGVMILAVILFRGLFLKKLPKQCFRLLWILVALRLLIPFFFTIEVESEHLPMRGIRTAVFNVSDIANSDIGGDHEVSEDSFVGINAGVAVVYALGMIISGGSMAYAYIRMRRLALGALPVDGEWGERWNGTDVRCAEGFGSPFSCGVVRPIIYLPEYMLAFDKNELDMIIAHEKQHIKSCDQFVKWLIAAAVCVNWFDPLAWVMLQLANRDIELACDEAVVRECGEKRSYALTLIKAAETRNASAVCSFSAPVLNERIECIMKSKRITVCGFIFAALILGIMSVFFVQISAVKRDSEPYHGGDGQFESEYLCGDAESLPEEKTVTHYVPDGVGEVSDSVFADVVFVCPLAEYSAVTGEFGEQVSPIGKVYFNTGMNIAAEIGACVYAAADGTVVTAEYDHKYGNYVVIEHENGYQTVYRHLGKLYCEAGEEVDAGYEIGTVGQTGTATGPNLGFSIVKDGAYISPAKLFE